MNKKKVVIFVAVFLIALVGIFAVTRIGKNKGVDSPEAIESNSLQDTINNNAKKNPKDFRGFTYEEYEYMVEEIYIKTEDNVPARVEASYKDNVFTLDLYSDSGEIMETYTVDKDTGDATSNLGRKINFETGTFYNE